MSRWTKKKLFTIGFKGRKRRSLLWRKGVYEEWFEYAKIAQKQGLVLPIEFGDLLSFNDFEQWWRDPNYGFELFCEPVMEGAVSVIEELPESIIHNHLLLDIDLNCDQDKLIDLVTRSIKKKQGRNIEYVSQARFQPSKPMKHIDRQNLKLAREVWLLTQDGVPHKDIVDKKRLLPREEISNSDAETMMLSGLRKVSRYKRAVDLRLKGISKGIFP